MHPTTKLAIAAVAMLYLVGCGADRIDAEQFCEIRLAAYFNEGLTFHLTLAGVASTQHPTRGVCVAQDRKSELQAAMQRLEEHFDKVAGLLADECEERALSEWAESQNLRYEIVDATTDGRPVKMFLLRSFTAEEVADHRQKLFFEAPRHVRCAG